MSAPFQLQRPQIVDSRGVPVRGAKASFYDADTGIRRRAFRNAEMTEEHVWPVVADSAGRFPMVYLADGIYKVVIEDDLGRSVYSDPNVVIGNGSAVSLPADFRITTVGRFQSAYLTADDANTLQNVTANGYPVTMLLPSAELVGNGKSIIVRKAGGDANVAAKTADGSKINGVEEIRLTDQHQYIWLTSDGGAWIGLTINQAAQVSFKPGGSITAIDVQSAILQVDSRFTSATEAVNNAYEQISLRVAHLENVSLDAAQQLFSA
jgi:hypothetical protein